MVHDLKNPEVIAYPDFNVPFILHCDASQTGLGAVLYQKQGERLRVISSASRTLNPAEQNYNLHSGKLEFLALKWSVTEKFADYLHYGPPFEIFTDNNPLTYVMTTAKLNACGLRWVSELANYQFSLKYKSGSTHLDADFISRLPPLEGIVKMMGNSDVTLSPTDVSVVLSGTKMDYMSDAEISLVTLEEQGEGCSERIKPEELARAQQDDKIIGPIYSILEKGKSIGKKERKELSRKSRVLARGKFIF